MSRQRRKRECKGKSYTAREYRALARIYKALYSTERKVHDDASCNYTTVHIFLSSVVLRNDIVYVSRTRYRAGINFTDGMAGRCFLCSRFILIGNH